MNLDELTKELEKGTIELVEKVSLSTIAEEIKDLLIPVPNRHTGFKFHKGNYKIIIKSNEVSLSSSDGRVNLKFSGEDTKKFYNELFKRYEEEPLLYETNRRVQKRTDSIRWMGIGKADLEKHIYEGYITCSDYIEKCIFSDTWITEANNRDVQEVNGKKYGFEIKCRNGMGKYEDEFTANSGFNRRIRQYIIQGILEFNPNVPSLKKD